MRPWALALLLFSVASFGQTYTPTTIYSFGASAKDGSGSTAGLVMDSAGNFYGTTSYGGIVNTMCPKGCGTIFKLSNGVETVLHAFRYTDGATPSASLIIDKSGNLYGTTVFGGTYFNGTVFKATAAGKFGVFHHFGSIPNDGRYPLGPVTADNLGNIYGVTSEGGNSTNACATGVQGCGIVFKLSTKGAETILYKFTGTGGDGIEPSWNLLRDNKNNLYGVAYGSTSPGIIFQISPSGQETILYSGNPVSYLARNAAGNFFGAFTGNDGDGIWEVSGQTETDFSACQGCLGGFVWSPLVFYNGIMYGTSAGGGDFSAGTVYSFDPSSGIQTVLYSFPSGSTEFGGNPYSGVIADSKGNLYGTTYTGGANGVGTVFELVKQ